MTKGDTKVQEDQETFRKRQEDQGELDRTQGRPRKEPRGPRRSHEGTGKTRRSQVNQGERCIASSNLNIKTRLSYGFRNDEVVFKCLEQLV